jgi:hypothetical protein
MVWWSAHAVTAMDIFKIQDVNVVQNAGALGSLRRKQNKIRIFPREIINCHGYLRANYRSPSKPCLKRNLGPHTIYCPIL